MIQIKVLCKYCLVLKPKSRNILKAVKVCALHAKLNLSLNTHTAKAASSRQFKQPTSEQLQHKEMSYWSRMEWRVKTLRSAALTLNALKLPTWAKTGGKKKLPAHEELWTWVWLWKPPQQSARCSFVDRNVRTWWKSTQILDLHRSSIR